MTQDAVAAIDPPVNAMLVAVTLRVPPQVLVAVAGMAFNPLGKGSLTATFVTGPPGLRIVSVKVEFEFNGMLG